MLLSNPGFDNGKGLHIHLRTKISTWWSYIESAVVQIGDETVEVMGAEDGKTKYWVNGKQGQPMNDKDKFILEDHEVSFQAITDQQHRFRFKLGKKDALSVETLREFVKVNVKITDHTKLQGASGLMGKHYGHYPPKSLQAVSNPVLF